MKDIKIYDTTLRDGNQAEEINFSDYDKLRITAKLDDFGVHYIEGGWPGANRTDSDFFKKAKKLRLTNSKITAFGSTHKAGIKVKNDKNVIDLLNAETQVVTIFGKTWDLHAEKALKISLNKNLELIYDTVSYLKARVEEVIFDAEHFFDGYIKNQEYALKCLAAAEEAGADTIVLCDTRGGLLTYDLGKIIQAVKGSINTELGIHCHNDSELAVANTLEAARQGVRHVQGTINGYGERIGNANLCSIIPNLQLKQDYKCIPEEKLKLTREVSRFVNEVANMRQLKRQPYVGNSAFAHKAGIHYSAVSKNPETYEHIAPEAVGNFRRILASGQAGKSIILRKIKDFNIPLKKDSPILSDIMAKVKDLESAGYQFEAADASLELLIRRMLNKHENFFELKGFRVIVLKKGEGEEPVNEATIKIKVKGNEEHTAAIGNGPVNALDNALRKSLIKFYPELKKIKLIDYKVHVIESADGQGTEKKVIVFTEMSDGSKAWSTVGVDENIVEASWQAIVDSIEYYLLKNKGGKI